MVRDLCSKRTAADKIMNKMNENRKIVLDTLNEQNIEYEMFEHQAVYTVDEIEDSDLWNHENVWARSRRRAACPRSRPSRGRSRSAAAVYPSKKTSFPCVVSASIPQARGKVHGKRKLSEWRRIVHDLYIDYSIECVV